MPQYLSRDPNAGLQRPQKQYLSTDPNAGRMSADAPQPAQDASWLDTAVDALPTVGGAVGSLVGGGKWNPLGMTGAALGGAAGAGFQTLARRGGEIPGAVADIARNLVEQPSATIRGGVRGLAGGAANAVAAGATQAALEGVGRGIVAPIAKAGYRVGMRPVKALRDKYGRKALIDEGFEQGILPTAGGAAKAKKAMQASRLTQRGMAESYDVGGGEALSVPAAAGRGVRPLLQKIEQQEAATGTAGGSERVMTQMRRLFKRHAGPIKAADMMDLKQAADEIADPAYLAAAKLGGAPILPTSRASIAKGLSKGYREMLNEVVGPAFAKQGLKTKTRYGVARMAHEASERPEALANYFALGSGAVGYGGSGGDVGEGIKTMLATRALMSPRVQAGASLALRPLALYGTRGADVLTGSNMEQLMRQALLARMGGSAPTR